MIYVVLKWIATICYWLHKDVSRIFYLTAVLCLIYVVQKTIKVYQWRRRLNKALKSFPGPPVHWLFGNVHEFKGRGNDLDKALEWSKKYPRAFPVWFGKFVVYVTLNDADYVKTVCARGGKKWCILPLNEKNIKDFQDVILLGRKGLLTLQGKKWFQHRKLLTPGFHYGVLKPYVSLITKSAQVMLVGSAVTIVLYTLLNAFRMSFNNLYNFSFSENSYIQSVFELTFQMNYRIWYLPYHIDLIYWLSSHGRRFKKACDTVHLQTDKVIQERKKSLKDERELEKIQKKRHLDFLDILLCAKVGTEDPWLFLVSSK
uniref:Cytochrome P450 n=1 Tax=Pelusios castaneus TaxID=367368 RepID=A0A8C8VEX0_9SAUR